MIDNPLFLTPRNVSRVWGGDRLATEFGRQLNSETIGESWEVHGDLEVAGTEQSLDQVVEKYGGDFLGSRVDASAGFPLLTKWLDCKAWLSIQVHPDDTLAREFTGDSAARGKTEAWYIHRADPEAELIHGLARGTTLEMLRLAKGKDVVPLLDRRRPTPGQLLHTPAGVVHALGPGNLLYEVQQSCDLTYRFFDWSRDRELHPEKALECVERGVSGPGHVTEDHLTCPYFEMELVRAPESWNLGGTSVQILATTQSGLSLHWSKGSKALHAGQSVVLPAALGEVSVEGVMTEPLLRIQIPEAVW